MRRQRYRELVTAYLRSDSLPPVLLRRVAERDPQRSSEVFRQLLKKPRFSWERDGEALLRRYKRQFFEREPMPSFTPVSTQLAGLARSGAQQPGGTTGEPDDGPRP